MIFYRPKSLDDYRPFIALDEYDAVYVPGSEVAWADYEALKRDFPFLAGLNENEINQWIVENFSYISPHQLELGTLRNTAIPTTEKKTKVYRQANYGPEFLEFQGRGDLMEVRDLAGKVVGVLDRKGVGVSRRKIRENLELLKKLEKEGQGSEAIQTKSMTNGLMYLGEAMTEAALIKVTQRVFDILNHREEFDRPFPKVGVFKENPLQVIDGYFVLKFPFSLRAGPHGNPPAAIYARQAHVGRVWAGKVYTRTVNIKQADFFFALCDGGTVRIRLPELEGRTSKIKGGPDLLHHQMGAEIVADFLAGEKKALAKAIDEVLEPVQAELAKIDAKRKPRAELSPEEIFSLYLDVMEADPRRFLRYAEVMWFVQKHSPELFAREKSRIQKLVRFYLTTPHAEKDIDESGKPVRRWGFLLHSALESEERKKVLAASFWDISTEPEFLARAVLLTPLEEVWPHRKNIFRRAGGWWKTHLELMLADPALANDARRPGWEKIFAWVKEQKNPPPVVALDKQKWVWRVNVKPILLNWRDAL